MQIQVSSRCLSGRPVTVCVQGCRGKFTIAIQGLQDNAGRASHRRVMDSLRSLDELPLGHFDVTIKGHPASESSAHLDLPIVIGIAGATQWIAQRALKQLEFFGRLRAGALQRETHDLAPALLAAAHAVRDCIVPYRNVNSLIANPQLRRLNYIGAMSAREVIHYLRRIAPMRGTPKRRTNSI